MQTSADYRNHVNIVKELNLYTTVRDNQRPYEAQFEDIYQKATEADVTLETAKDFLNDLSTNELRTVQKFEGLADAINVDSLSSEGAYNLLVHSYEKYDWDNDGITEIGKARTSQMVPQNMDDETKRAWVKAINAMGDDMMSVLVLTSSFNVERMNRQIAEHFSEMSDAQIDELQQHAGYDIRRFIEETLSKPYVPQEITFLDILNKIDGILSGSDAGYSSAEMLASTQRLKEVFEQAYEEVKASRLSTEQVLDVKEAAANKSDEVTQSNIEKLLQADATAITQGIDKSSRMAEMIEKYSDVMLPMPSHFSQEREDLQTAIIRERYPDYLPPDEALEKYGFKAESSRPETAEEKAAREEANRQFIEERGGQEAWEERVAFIQSVLRKYPNNYKDKYFDIPNSAERANVINAAVYESLEQGDDLQTAMGKAHDVVSLYLDNTDLFRQMFERSRNFFSDAYAMFDTASGEDPAPEEGGPDDWNEREIVYDGTVLDLRKYGFDRDLSTRRLYEDDIKMVTAIENRLNYARFLIENPDIVQEAFEKMDPEFTKDKEIYSSYINPAKAQIPTAELALDVFSKYKIFA